MYEFSRHLDPKLGDITSPAPEIVQKTIDDVHATGRMAVLHLAPDDGRCAGKDALLPPLRKVAHDAVLVHKSHIHGKMGEQQVDLFRCQRSCIEIKSLIARCSIRRRFRYLDTFGNLRFPLIARADQTVTDLLALIADGQPLGIVEHL